MNPLFSSFLQAGFECSTHKLRNGRRLDLLASTSHDLFIAEDYARLKQVGISTVREGVRWHLAASAPGKLDFASVLPYLSAARKAKIEVIWDLFHFGWPDQFHIFSQEWVEQFGRLAFSFADMLREDGQDAAMILPINEISFFSWAGGDVNYLNPFEHGRGPELKEQMVRAWLVATRSIKKVLPNARILSAEPVIHIIGDPSKPGDDAEAENYRRSMFEAWDMILGRSHPELGGHEAAIDVIGVNFYDRNQWMNFGRTLDRDDSEYRPFHKILIEVYERYGRPMFVSETGTEGNDRPAWFAYIVNETKLAISMGVPMEGICLYPILNHPGWDDDRHCHNGLWDYPSPTGARLLYEPLAEEIRRQQALLKEESRCLTK